MITEITSDIKYIGADDTDIDLFESQYVVPNGISYNSYVILDEKIAIMDTVDNRKQHCHPLSGSPYCAQYQGCANVASVLRGC